MSELLKGTFHVTQLVMVHLLILLLLPLTAWADSGAETNGCGPGGWKGALVPEHWPSLLGIATGPLGIPIGFIRNRAHLHRACDEHDLCYSSVGVSQYDCDLRFLSMMQAECDQKFAAFDENVMQFQCRRNADIYYQAVATLGAPHFAEAQTHAVVRPPAISRPAETGSVKFKLESKDPSVLLVQFCSETYEGYYWPGPAEAWVLEDWDRHNFELSCVPGEKVCFGAFSAWGGTQYWGSGELCREACEACCTVCGDSLKTDLMP